MRLLNRLWSDEQGFIVSAELVLIATILVIGLIVGMVTVRDDVLAELADVADAFSEIVQSYSFAGITGHSASTAGSAFHDLSDWCELASNGISGDQSAGAFATCVAVTGFSNE